MDYLTANLPDELLKIAHEIDNDQYTWNSGKVRNKFGMSITYLAGYPTGKIILKQNFLK